MDARAGRDVARGMGVRSLGARDSALNRLLAQRRHEQGAAARPSAPGVANMTADEDYARAIAYAADHGDEPPLPLALGWQSKRVTPALALNRDKTASKRIRKAFASRGDDTTLSRFVKIKGGPTPHVRPKGLRPPGLANPSIEAGRSIFYRKGITAPGDRVLVSGHSN